MAKYEFTAELHLKNFIAETRETAEALKEFADRLEQIEKKYTYKAGSEDAVVAHKNLCDSCVTKHCMFQSGVIRKRCDFYKAGSEDKE